MLLSQYFLPTLKERPVEAEATSHALMLRSGMIKQHAAGIYSWLPLGYKVLQNISNVIRQNMDATGAIELCMPCVQPAELWVESNRLNSYGKELLKFQDRHDNSLLFGPTNEEMITDIFRDHIQSYRALPKNLYHIQWKFRDEIRPRFGVMRGREFLMKDAYTFDIDHRSAMRSYNLMYAAYMHSFMDMRTSVIPVRADNGVIGGSLSHEFHVIANVGESTIYYDRVFDVLAEDFAADIHRLQSIYAATDEKHNPATCSVPEGELRISKSIEVGQIFAFGTKYSIPMQALVNDKNGDLVPVHMGSYGIGISRTVAAIIEVNHDERGIIWPVTVAPFKVSILNLNMTDSRCGEMSLYLYNNLRSFNIDTLYDDTDERPGVKFATHDLIGSPWQLIVGTKNANNDLVELKHRATGETEIVHADIAIKKIIGDLNVK